MAIRAASDVEASRRGRREADATAILLWVLAGPS
jgi:hypothetical protein